MSFSLSKKYSQLRRDITTFYRLDEKIAVDNLYQTLDFTPEQERKIQENAIDLINKVRNIKKNKYGIDALMQEFF